MIAVVKQKIGLPLLLLVVFALTRWPGVLPLNFSAAYALLFCAGVYFPRHLAWWLPMLTMLVTDVALNLFYYHTGALNPYMLVNYAAYLGIVGLGRAFSGKPSFLRLVFGGVLGALLFYFITNTAAWLQNAGYARTLAGWLQALTTGLPGYPSTWEFFRNTLSSGGLFTALFVGAMKLGEEVEESETEEAEEKPDEAEQPDEAKA